MLIFGKGLDSPIAIPARDLKQNNPEMILDEIDKLDMSGKKFTLLSNPMRIIITTISPPKGSGLKRLPVKFMDNNEKGLIKNNNEENCLYYAVILAQFYAECSENTTRDKFKKFRNFYKNPMKQKNLVDQLLLEMNIKPEKSSGFDEISRIQEFFDKKYANKFRLILFDANSIYIKPIWKGPRERTHNLILYLSANHYHVIINLPMFFKLSKKYCLECEITYSA